MANNKRLSDLDKEYIAAHCEHKTDAEIAKHLGCSTRTVARVRSSLHITKPGGKYKENEVSKSAESVEEAVRKPMDLSESELISYYIKQFKMSSRGKRLKNLMSEDEYDVFIEQWVGFHLQLEDITHAEQNTIEQIILLKLRLDHNQKQYRTQVSLQEKLLEEAGVTSIDDLDMSDPDQFSLAERINMCGVQALNLNKDYKETLDRLDKLNQSLNVTRKQREEKGRVGGDTFFSKCQEFTKRSNREKEGRMAELLKMATYKNMNKLRQGIRYMDGEVAPQLLDEETVKMMEEQNQKQEGH